MKSFLSVVFLPMVLFFAYQQAYAQVLKPIKWKTEIKHISGNQYNLVYTATIDKTWTVYSQYTSDDGPVPTSITYEEMEGIKLLGKATEAGAKKEGIDPVFEVNVIKFIDKQPFVITQKVEVTDPSKPIIGYLTFMACDDKKCLQPTDIEFNFIVPAPSTSSITQAAEKTTKEEKASSPNEPIQITNVDIAADNNATTESPEGVVNPAQWTYREVKISDTEYDLIFEAVIDAGWNVYSQEVLEDGPFPTTITYENKDGVKIIGTAKEEGDKKVGMDPLFGVVVTKYLSGDTFRLTQRVELTDPTKVLSGYLTYIGCNDSYCTKPIDVEFSFNWGGQATSDAQRVMANIQGDTINQLISSLFSTYKDPIADCGTVVQENKGYFWTFIFGFLGGLLALLTPCVFPMIPITVSFFTKDNKRKGWVNGLIYGASIILIYVFLGLVITSFFGPEALNRLSTNWIANTLFFIIFIAFAFSFFGFYEITLPSSWSTKSDQMADKGGLIGIFFMAFTLALVSFSCTGPIIGTALVQAAAKGEYLGPFLVMFGFSLALALPFGLFAAFPSWLNSLPRSGGWMNSVKVVLGFLEIALAFKFLSVADMTNHWGFLRYELFMGIWILVFLGMALYLFGVFKFPHDSKMKKLSPTRGVFAILASAAVIYLLTGFMKNEKTESYNALSLMSGLAPPTEYNFFLPPPEVDPLIKAEYPSYSKCANNIDCFKDYYEGLDYARKNNKPVFLDFTGHGCVNCRKTEQHIWVDDRITEILKDEVVLISLYVDDDTVIDPKLTSAITGERIRNIGRKWGDFQIVNFEQNTQPLYVMVTLDEKVITTPRPYKEGVKDYLSFLECGLKTFETSQGIGAVE